MPFVAGLDVVRAEIGVGQEAEQPIGRLAGLRGGADDGAIILAQDLQPGADIVGMADGQHDGEGRAAESGVDLGDLS